MKFAIRVLNAFIILAVMPLTTYAQTYTTADVISLINRLGGFSLYPDPQDPQFHWLIVFVPEA